MNPHLASIVAAQHIQTRMADATSARTAREIAQAQRHVSRRRSVLGWLTGAPRETVALPSS
jgi:hypothetical protein